MLRFLFLQVAPGQGKSVAIIGGGLSGLACAKYLSEAGHKVDNMAPSELTLQFYSTVRKPASFCI